MSTPPSPPHARVTGRAIDAIAADLFEPLLRAEPSSSQWRLVGWDNEQGLQVSLERGDDALLVELEAVDPTRPCYARTLRFNVCARRSFDAARPLGMDERRVIDQLVALIRSREGRLPLLQARSNAGRGTEVREIEVRRLLVAEGCGHYYINPYVGCMIGCSFCYVAERADLSRALAGDAELPWGRYVDVKVNAAEVLRREVTRYPPGVVRLSPILTDPYQPLEKRYRITRACLEVLLEAGFTPAVLTRAGRVRDDIDLLARFPVAALGISIPTDDDHVRAQFEPGADPIDERIAALEAAQRAGLRTCAVIQPMLPMNVARLVSRIAPLVKVVRIDRMHRMDRARALYEAAGCLEAAEDVFFQRTERELRAAFAARGVATDDSDDLTSALGFDRPLPPGPLGSTGPSQ